MRYETPFFLDQHMMLASSVERREEIEKWLERNGIEGKYYKNLTAIGHRARLVTVKTDRVFEMRLAELPPEHWTPWFG